MKLFGAYEGVGGGAQKSIIEYRTPLITESALEEFVTKWKLDQESQELFVSLPSEVQSDVLNEFAPRNTKQDVNRVFMKFARGRLRNKPETGNAGSSTDQCVSREDWHPDSFWKYDRPLPHFGDYWECRQCYIHKTNAPSGLFQCSRCESSIAIYCGKKCQRRHWKSVHRYECDFIRDCENRQYLSTANTYQRVLKLREARRVSEKRMRSVGIQCGENVLPSLTACNNPSCVPPLALALDSVVPISVEFDEEPVSPLVGKAIESLDDKGVVDAPDSVHPYVRHGIEFIDIPQEGIEWSDHSSFGVQAVCAISLSGVTHTVEVRISDYRGQGCTCVREALAELHDVPFYFVRLTCCRGIMSEEGTAVALCDGRCPLPVVFDGADDPVVEFAIMDRIPFVEDVTPQGSRVTVDGYDAIFTSPWQGWSRRVRFDFVPTLHPTFGPALQTKYYRFIGSGNLECGRRYAPRVMNLEAMTSAISITNGAFRPLATTSASGSFHESYNGDNSSYPTSLYVEWICPREPATL